jgi:hypothetical protein
MAASGARSHEHSRGAGQRGGAESDEHLPPFSRTKSPLPTAAVNPFAPRSDPNRRRKRQDHRDKRGATSVRQAGRPQVTGIDSPRSPEAARGSMVNYSPQFGCVAEGKLLWWTRFSETSPTGTPGWTRLTETKTGWMSQSIWSSPAQRAAIGTRFSETGHPRQRIVGRGINVSGNADLLSVTEGSLPLAAASIRPSVPE